MIIGVPKEIKDKENRIAMTPAGVMALKKRGHQVLVQSSGGLGSGFSDEEYLSAGAEIVDDPAEIYRRAEMIVKVKEPLPQEYDMLRPEQILFTYLHLAAEPKLAENLLRKKVMGIAYETIELEDGSLPLLAPMSEVAGRMSVQIGAQFLEKVYGGKGILLGGVPGVPPAEVTIIGGGVVGLNAAKMAVGLGADVTVLDINAERLRYLDDMFQGRVKTVISNEFTIWQSVTRADLVIGAVLQTGKRAPKLVTEEMVRSMQPGSVIVDVAVDQGGCVETIDRVTTHSDPVYEKYGVLHYAVANIPGIVPRTSTLALTNSTLPYIVKLADLGLDAIKKDAAFAKGVNTYQGYITHKGVADSLNMEYVPLEELM